MWQSHGRDSKSWLKNMVLILRRKKDTFCFDSRGSDVNMNYDSDQKKKMLNGEDGSQEWPHGAPLVGSSIITCDRKSGLEGLRWEGKSGATTVKTVKMNTQHQGLARARNLYQMQLAQKVDFLQQFNLCSRQSGLTGKSCKKSTQTHTPWMKTAICETWLNFNSTSFVSRWILLLSRKESVGKRPNASA